MSKITRAAKKYKNELQLVKETSDELTIRYIAMGARALKLERILGRLHKDHVIDLLLHYEDEVFKKELDKMEFDIPIEGET